MSEEWEQYRERYAAERMETFDAYVDVWTRAGDARRKFSDWALFARCADADLATIREVPDLVREAEAIMARNGYRIGPAAGGRTWQRTGGKLRSDYSTPATARVAGTATRRRNSRATTNKPSLAKATAPAAPTMRPRHIECPNDPGMMVPLDGECMCGWVPADA